MLVGSTVVVVVRGATPWTSDAEPVILWSLVIIVKAALLAA